MYGTAPSARASAVPADPNPGRSRRFTLRGALGEGTLLAGGVLLAGLIALLDYATGPDLAFGILYLAPVAACAWWGGFTHGILASLAASFAGSMVAVIENPRLAATAGVWNGIAHFCTLVLTSSLIARLRAGVLREQTLARTDPLTGAANGRTFYEAAAAEAEAARRLARPLTVAYLDLDNFKQLNDRLGHAAGDEALLQLVHTIRLNLRSTDLLARLGGDEFSLLLPGTDSDGAVSLLGRLQELVAIEMTRQGLPVTLSVGAITFERPPTDVDVMVQQVDAVMYRAKMGGKARVEHASVRDCEDDPRAAERRAMARMLCNRAARVRPEGAVETGEEFAVVRDMSPGGIALHLERRFPRGTVVIVEPLAPGARTLLARVLRARREEGGWVHGCTLSCPLSAEEMHVWLGSTASIPARQED